VVTSEDAKILVTVVVIITPKDEEVLIVGEGLIVTEVEDEVTMVKILSVIVPLSKELKRSNSALELVTIVGANETVISPELMKFEENMSTLDEISIMREKPSLTMKNACVCIHNN